MLACWRCYGAEAPRHFEIAAQPVAGALNEFARQANITLVFAPERVAHRSTRGLHGDYTTQQALALLLAGTGLPVTRINQSTIAVGDAAPLQPSGADPRPQSAGRAGLLGRLLVRDSSGAVAGNGRDPSPAPPDAVEEIIVTGTAGGAGLRRQDASFTITTVSALQIELAAPKSSAELLSQIPGVWVESSGGVAGANINVIGFPEAGDAPHVTLELNGTPLYGTESLAFMEQSSLFRADETVASLEAVLGGSGSVFGKGEPGLTANFRLKQGGERTQGIVKYTVSDYQLQRLDLELSGKLADDCYYMLGGYVQGSSGIRDAQFLAERGQQFTLNLTRRWASATVDAWLRATDDAGQWLLPMFSGSGNDLGTFTQLGDATRLHDIQVGVDALGNARSQQFDFGRGRGWRGTVGGLNAEFSATARIVLRDDFGALSGDADTFGLVPDGGALQVAALGLPAGAVRTAISGQPLRATDWVQEYGYWVVQKRLHSYTNDFSLAFSLAGIHDLTIGYYSAQWSSHDWWSLNNAAPVHNVAHGELLDAPVDCQRLAAAGSGASCWHYGLAASGAARATALYLADSVRLGPALRLDAGVRHERQALSYTLDLNDGDYSYPDGTINLAVPDASGAANAYTLALNYAHTPRTGAFVRYTQGYGFPNFDSFRNGGGAASLQSIREAEAGYKHDGPVLRFYATGFWNESDAFAGAVGGIFPAGAFESRAYGMVIDGNIRRDPLSLGINATLQHGVYLSSSADPAQVGKQVLRQPGVRVLLSPVWQLRQGPWPITLSGSLSYIGRRPADQDNSFFFDPYVSIDAGIRAESPRGLALQLIGQNLSDRHDATEGDPRSAVAANYRPILGRSLRLSASLRF